MLQVDYLSTALLAILLLPILQAKRKLNSKAKPPVLSIVTSDTAHSARLATVGPVLQQLDTPKGFSAMPWYSKSKLLLTMFTAKLAEFIDSHDVLINLVNPSMTKGTAFGSNAPAILRKIFQLIQALLARSISVGATTYVDAVVAHGEESHGSFISEWTIKP
jgi:NAD(P)-dependent dehydrogenase (short-subunit alcohol dehydrogenase family)